MPEGDTVWRTAEMLRVGLTGKTLTRCDIRVPRYATVDLAGLRVDEVLSRGKHLFIRVADASIHSHLKMDGSWRVHPLNRPSRAGHRIRILLEAAGGPGSDIEPVQAVGIDLGVLQVLDRRHDMDVVAHLGPDLLGPDWDAEVAAANLTADPDRPLAEALLDQRVLAGVGNVYCNELCFVTGHLPTTAAGAVTDPVRMMQRARDMLWLNRTRWNRTTTGDTRQGRDLWVYGRGGKPCRRCGTLIARDAGGERVSYWCPHCQR
ncbi:endonuclease VIII Nei2 [Mycolicibacterium thermoresistibile]|uniref:DNA-(apurinic or apyrimidinic site) lyase n=2 Tax=Mycolicibacterium thermoresistibile TaxID=1797 RepID=G7CB65_MYCT3|nr:endonuclease VIII Nei2 [Mycolicibacterium thermoresistibile]EHI14791.1 DNA-formamidopyrimidine glycosylase [Mycolicibacterium thermoresistibile ATCC 19527]MCV7189828.1 Fpg/Nei family DNA glycosylase [Mycolicibacterium thermoresistibile]GAT16485.1 endonuclease VIII [Mycolicibacterium thermoresistibile]